MESQPQNPEFRNHPENFHPCQMHLPMPVKCAENISKRSMLTSNFASLL